MVLDGRAEPAQSDGTILYLQPPTIDRLLAQQRITLYTEDGVVRAVFIPDDPRYPGAAVRPSYEVIANSVHRRRWLADEQRHIFEYIGDV
jgi:hypothetical protein